MSERWHKFPSSALLIVCSTFNLLYSFFWVIPQHPNFIYQHFGTLGLFRHHRRCKSTKMEQSVPILTSEYKIQTPRNHPKERIQHSEHDKSLKSSQFILYMNLFRSTEENEYLSLLFTFLLLPDSSASIYQDYLSLIIDEQKYNTKGISYVLFPAWNRKLFLTGLKVSDVYVV